MNKSKTPPPHFNLDRQCGTSMNAVSYSTVQCWTTFRPKRLTTFHTHVHTSTSESTSLPSSPAVRVRRHAQTHYDTRSTQGSIYRPSGYTLTRSTSWASSMLYPEGSEPSPFREAGPHDNINTMTLGKDGITHIKENHTPPSTQNPARSQRRR